MRPAVLRWIVVAGLLAAAMGTSTLATAGRGGGCHDDPTVAEGTTVLMERSCFVGTVTYAPVGEAITFVNRDKLPHTVTGVGWDGGEVDGFARKDVGFEEEGVYVYTCVYHPGMSGAIVIGDATGPGPAEGGSVSIVQPKASKTPKPTPDPGPESTPVPAAALGAIAGLVGGGVGFGLARRRR